MTKLFSEHLESVDETYFEHMGQAFGFGGRMLVAGLACIAHGLLPNLFTTTGSRTIMVLHERMVAKRRRHERSAALPDYAI